MILKDFLQLRKRRNLPSVLSITSRSKRQKKKSRSLIQEMASFITWSDSYWNFSRSWMWKNKTRGYYKSTGKYKKKRCRDYCTASRVISGFCGVLRSNLILPRLPQQFLSLILVLPTVLLLLIYYRSHKKQIHTVGLGIVFPKECILLPV